MKVIRGGVSPRIAPAGVIILYTALNHCRPRSMAGPSAGDERPACVADSFLSARVPGVFV